MLCAHHGITVPWSCLWCATQLSVLLNACILFAATQPSLCSSGRRGSKRSCVCFSCGCPPSATLLGADPAYYHSYNPHLIWSGDGVLQPRQAMAFCSHPANQSHVWLACSVHMLCECSVKYTVGLESASKHAAWRMSTVVQL